MKGDETLNGSAQNVVPLRTILQNFLNLVENYEARRNGGLDAYDAEFQELKQFSESLKSDVNYSCKEGERSINRKKNRYKDILPFDYSRVKLTEVDDGPGSDYINASVIKGASGSAAYIAAQGPLTSTLNSFWQCIWEQQVQVIVMACNEQESGKHKCENYWVDEDETEREFGPITVWLKKCRNICPDFLIRTMRIRHTDLDGKVEERNVCQFHYSAWPDHSVPKEVKPLLDMVRLIRDCQTSETLPVLVHCSAGCGRTGTICAIDQIWGLLRLGRLSPDFSLFNLVKEMRRQRIAMVQTKDQYILVHRAVKELFQEQLKIIDAHTYANVDINGLPIEIKRELEEPTYETLEFTSEVKKNRSLLLPLVTPQTLTNTSVADANDIIVSVSNINTNGITMNHIRSSSLSPKLDVSLSSSSACNHTSASIPSRGKSSSSKLEKEVENYQKHMEQEKNRGKNSTRSKTVPGDSQKKKLLYLDDDDDHDGGGDDNNTGERESKTKHEKDREMKNNSNNNNNNTSDTELSDREKKMQQSSKSSSSSSGSNLIRSALLRKPSIVKLKSFFEKMSKEDKERKHATGQLSRTKSDLSTRFYSFNNPFGSSKSQSATTGSSNTGTTSIGSSSKQIASTSSKNSSPTSQEEPSSSSKTVHGKVTISSNDKPQKPPKPILPIKRSKSLKATLVPDSVKFSAFTSHKRSEQHTANKQHPQKGDASLSSNPTSTNSSMGSSSSSGGFLNITDNTNPIKVCVKQVEMPKLQAIVSKSVKPPAHTATTTSHEDDYDIDDRSHLRRENNSSSSNNNNSGSSSTSASKNQPFTNNIEPPPTTTTMESSSQLEQSSTSFSSSLPKGESKTTNNSSGFHIPHDNHNNYVNFSYSRSKHNTKSNNDNIGSSKIRNKTGMAREMEDLLGIPHYSDSKMKYEKLKKCDTVNPRLIAASLGFSRKNERTSLTRSQSHVWQQFDKTPTPVRIFSNDNIYQSSPPLLPPPPPPQLQSQSSNTTQSVKIGKGDYHKRNSLEQSTTPPFKYEQSEYQQHSTTSANNTNNNNGFIIQAINADVSVKPLGLYENIRPSSSNNSYSRENEGNISNSNTLKTSSSSSLDMTDKPIVRRRVPKTNPYANYPACVTGSNSKFPFQSSNSSSSSPPPPLLHNNNNNNIGNESLLKTTIPQSDHDNFSNHNSNNNSGNPNINYSNYTSTSGHYSNIPPLKTRGSDGSVGNSSSDSSSNMGTPRNSSLPSTPTQSVDILYPPLSRPNNLLINNNNNNNSSGQYPTKSILKESLPSTPSESDEKIDTCSTKFYSNIPNINGNNTSNNNTSSSTSSSSSNIPKINTIRIAVGVRERRNSFRQAVWKESSTPQNSTTTNKDDINGNPSNKSSSSNHNNNNNNASITSIRNPSPIRSQFNESLNSNSNPVPSVHKNYEPIWPETPSTSYSNSNKNRHLPSYSTAILRNESRQNSEMNQKQLPIPLQPPLIPPPSSLNIPLHKTNSNSSSASFSFQDSIHKSNEIKTELSNSNAAQAKIDEIKLMLAELNSNPKGNGSNSGINSNNNSSSIYGKSINHNNPFTSATTTASSSTFSNHGNSSIKQQRSLRAPSRAQYQQQHQQQQGLSCFRKQTSYESIVDQLQAEEDDEYPLLARSNFPPQATKNITSVHHTQQQQQQQEPHYGVLRNMSSLGKAGAEVNNIEGGGSTAPRPGNDYVVLRQCKTYENPNFSNTSQQTPIPPPRLKRQQHINNANNYHHLQQHQQQLQKDLKPNHAVVGSGGITVHMSSQNNNNSTSVIKNQQQQQQFKSPYMNIPSSTEKMNDASSSSSASFSSFIKSRFASKNWTETKDRSNNISGNASTSSSSIKRGYENGTSDSNSTEQELDCGEPIKTGLNATKSSLGNHHPSVSGPLLTKHQYL